MCTDTLCKICSEISFTVAKGGLLYHQESCFMMMDLKNVTHHTKRDIIRTPR